MLTKSQLKARESGAIVRGVPGQKFKVNDTNYVIFLPYSVTSGKWSPEIVTLGKVRLRITKWPYGSHAGQVTGAVPDSWFVDLNADEQSQEAA
jgi:hypothetical protein